MGDCANVIREKIVAKFSDDLRFVGKVYLRTIWTEARAQSYADSDEGEGFTQLLPLILDNIHRDTDYSDDLLITASILLYINWSAWETFVILFTNPDRTPIHQLPLSKDVTSQKLKTYSHLFYNSQYYFVSPPILDGGNTTFKSLEQVPLEESETVVDEGGFGKVSKLKIAAGYFRPINWRQFGDNRNVSARSTSASTCLGASRTQAGAVND